LINVALEELEKDEVFVARILDVMAERCGDEADVAGLKICRARLRVIEEDGHARLAGNVVLPLVGLWMPVQLA
jgi:hypothetical protein